MRWQRATCEALSRRRTSTIFGVSALGLRWSFSLSSRGILLGGSSIMEVRDAATSAHERIQTCGSAASTAIFLEFRYLLGEPMVGERAFRQGTEDLAKAFRQVPLHNETIRYNVVCAWSPVAGKWQFFQMLAMPFGLKAQFNRVSALVTALARRVLGIPCLGIYRLQAFRVASRISSHGLGFITDLKKAQDPTAIVKILGTFEDASSTLGVDSFALCLTPERIQTVRSELLRVRDAPVLHLGGAGSAARQAHTLGRDNGWSRGCFLYLPLHLPPHQGHHCSFLCACAARSTGFLLSLQGHSGGWYTSPCLTRVSLSSLTQAGVLSLVSLSPICVFGCLQPRGHRLGVCWMSRVGSSMYFHLARRTSWSRSWLRHSCLCCSTLGCSNALPSNVLSRQPKCVDVFGEGRQ